jgi:ElaB/YqjD/DUF883 family membrane-anchored ribosome-binding protein
MSTETQTLSPEILTAQDSDQASGNPLHALKSASVQEALRATGAQAKQAAEELKAAAEAKAREWSAKVGAKVDEKTAEIRERAEVAYEDAVVRVKALQKDTEEYVRANPLKAVLIAVGAGFVLGALARR